MMSLTARPGSTSGFMPPRVIRSLPAPRRLDGERKTPRGDRVHPGLSPKIMTVSPHLESAQCVQRRLSRASFSLRRGEARGFNQLLTTKEEILRILPEKNWFA